MKTPVKHFISRFGLTFLVLLATIFWTAGCVWFVHHPDPLAGWQRCFSQDPDKLDKTMEADYQKYVKTLPQNDQKFILTINFFEDGTGQHAAKILIDSNGTEW